jgi:hypothetical protein
MRLKLSGLLRKFDVLPLPYKHNHPFFNFCLTALQLIAAHPCIGVGGLQNAFPLAITFFWRYCVEFPIKNARHIPATRVSHFLILYFLLIIPYFQRIMLPAPSFASKACSFQFHPEQLSAYV